MPLAICRALSRCLFAVRNGYLDSSSGCRTHGDFKPSSWRTCAPKVESHSLVSSVTESTPPTGVQKMELDGSVHAPGLAIAANLKSLAI